nr:uncharacterized protein LOC109155208 [Ipomoea trifida]
MKNIVVKGVIVILIPENDKSTSLDGEFDDSQFSSEDQHGNVVDTATTDVVEEFGNSIVQLNEIDCVDFEDELRSISSSFDVEGCNSNLVFSESKFNLEDFNKFQENMVFKDNKAFKWAVERAKQKAKLLVTDSQIHQYNLLSDYCEELMKTNPSTTMKLILDNTYSIEGRSRFKRLYICYGACKEGFFNGCRPLIRVDGCHLKGNQKRGQLLSAVGVDANNMYPIAFAVVEGELKETWKWFNFLNY